MKITSVKGTNDYLPNEVEIRDYLQERILSVYKENGFEHIITPAIEDIENLDKSDGGENLNLIFKIMKRGDKLDKALASGVTAANENELADMGLRYDLTLPLSRYFANNKDKLTLPMKCIRWTECTELKDHRRADFVSLSSAILILSVQSLRIRRLNLFLQQQRLLRLLA